MTCIKRIFFASLMVILAFVLPAFAEKRVALVIGNSKYTNVATLANPSNDAADIAASLRRLNFTVIQGLDLNKAGMNKAIRQYAQALKDADVALFFYAGHGLQVNGQNYLAPTGAQLKSESDLDFDMVPLALILRQMERSKRTNLVFLDACRNNPLLKDLARSMGVTRSANLTRGLARVETGLGTMISYSTQPGNVALDGKGRNSPFTTALLKHIERPGIDIAHMMISVRRDVLKASNNKQVPWENSSLTGQFYFKPGKPVTPALAPRIERSVDQSAIDLTFWNSVRQSNDPLILSEYLSHFPNGIFAKLAKLRLKALQGSKQVALTSPLEQTQAPLLPSPTRSIHACDRLAAHPRDPNKKAIGLFMHKIEAKKAIQACLQAVSENQHEIRFSYQLGRAYLADQNITDGKTWIQKVANKGYPAGMFSLGVLYYDKKYDQQDLTQALRWLKAAADKGMAFAMNMTGILYENGQGTSKDLNMARSYFSKAAEKGNAVAMFNLGRFYRLGKAVPRDFTQAVSWFKKSTELGYARAMVQMGRHYLHGRGITRDYFQAMNWLRKASDKGNRNAPAAIGLMHERGQGVTRDLREALRWFHKGDERGDAWSTNRLGWIYQNGRGTPQNISKALSYYRKAANQGNATGIYNMGVMHEIGQGVTKNFPKAVAFYQQATQKGEPNAMNNLGVMYEKGRGIRKNLKLAAQWYLKAATAGDANAMNNIGWFYETGRGRAVERSSKKAVDFFLKSLRRGSPHAKATFTKYANALSRGTKTEVQRRLQQAGVYSGVIDGQIGPGTRRALALYVKSGK